MNKNNNLPLLNVKELKKYFPIRSGFFQKVVGNIIAVDGVSFSIQKGETFGLVGESGCGKSTTGLCIIKLIEPDSGEIFFKDKNITSMNNNEFRSMRKKIQIIFQDPYGSLNPRMTIGNIIGEALEIHKLCNNQKEKNEWISAMIKRVGLLPEYINRYPHEFSGGQRQRIGIARALAVNPEIIIADEPVSALDVSIQSQIINLLQDIQEELGLSYLFIAHDLSVVKHISNRIGVMYLGKIIELADKIDFFNNPLHPYSQSLLSAIPIPDPFNKPKRIILKGDVPSPANLPSGCRFHSRCPKVIKICKIEPPNFKDYGNNHYAACHLLN